MTAGIRELRNITSAANEVPKRLPVRRLRLLFRYTGDDSIESSRSVLKPCITPLTSVFRSSTRLLALDLLLVLLFAAILVKRIRFHHLSTVPGPWIGRFSDLLDIIAIDKGSRTFRRHDVLLRYRSPVRAGTDHLLVSDLQSCTDIYGPSSNPCLKDPKVYAGFSMLGNPSLERYRSWCTWSSSQTASPQFLAPRIRGCGTNRCRESARVCELHDERGPEQRGR